MKRRAWFACGAMWGFSLGLAASGLLAYAEAVAEQYVRKPGSAVVVRLPGRRPA